MIKKLFITFTLLLLVRAAFASCSLNAPTASYGSYNSPLQTSDVLVNVLARVSCDSTSTGIPFTLSSNVVGLYGDTDTNRYLYNSSGSSYNKLYQNIYLDSGHTQIFGDGISVGSAYHGTTINGTNTVTFYGDIPGGQNVMAGTYTETFNITLTY